MDNKQFKQFCHTFFTEQGFKKTKNMYYLNGSEGVLCGISLQKSYYGPTYYINYYFFLGNFDDKNQYPSLYDMDIQDRIGVMSKSQKYNGSTFITALIDYEEYTEDELIPFFDKEFEEKILPPIYQGPKYILDNLGKLYHLTLNKSEVMRKLRDLGHTGDGTVC